MLARLSIRDIVLIDRLDIDFVAGLSVLTGETGAGKSILLDAFALALGARGDATLVRQGAEQGQVTAMFELPANHPARALLTESDIDADERADPAPRAVRRRPHPRLRQRPAGERAGAAGARRGAGRDPRPARRRARWSMPATHRAPARRLRRAARTTPRAVERLWRAPARGRGGRRRAIAPRSSARAREADWLRHAVEELRQARARSRARKPRSPSAAPR